MAPRAWGGPPFVSGASGMGNEATFRGIIPCPLRRFRRFRVYGGFVCVLFLRAVVLRHLFSFVPGVGFFGGGFVFLN